jgi:pyruvate kinase
MLQRMARAGMNIARLNMSHGDHDWHQRVIKQIKTLNRKIKFTVAILH